MRIYVRVTVVRWVDLEFPGWVEAQFCEADGTVVSLVDKALIFDGGDLLAPGAALPLVLDVPGDVLARDIDAAGLRVASVRLRSGLEEPTGRDVFKIRESDLIGPHL